MDFEINFATEATRLITTASFGNTRRPRQPTVGPDAETHLAGVRSGVQSPTTAGDPVFCAHTRTAQLDDVHVKHSGQPGSNLLGLMMIPDHHDDRT